MQWSRPKLALALGLAFSVLTILMPLETLIQKFAYVLIPITLPIMYLQIALQQALQTCYYDDLLDPRHAPQFILRHPMMIFLVMVLPVAGGYSLIGAFFGAHAAQIGVAIGSVAAFIVTFHIQRNLLFGYQSTAANTQYTSAHVHGAHAATRSNAPSAQQLAGPRTLSRYGGSNNNDSAAAANPTTTTSVVSTRPEAAAAQPQQQVVIGLIREQRQHQRRRL